MPPGVVLERVSAKLVIYGCYRGTCRNDQCQAIMV